MQVRGNIWWIEPANIKNIKFPTKDNDNNNSIFSSDNSSNSNNSNNNNNNKQKRAAEDQGPQLVKQQKLESPNKQLDNSSSMEHATKGNQGDTVASGVHTNFARVDNVARVNTNVATANDNANVNVNMNMNMNMNDDNPDVPGGICIPQPNYLTK